MQLSIYLSKRKEEEKVMENLFSNRFSLSLINLSGLDVITLVYSYTR